MSRRLQFILVVSAIIISSLIHYLVVRVNMEDGVYIQKAEVVLWLFYCKLFFSIIILVFLVAAIFIPKNNKLFAAVGFALPAASVCMMVGFIRDWAVPNHYLIAVGYCLVLLVSVMLAIFNARFLGSDRMQGAGA